MRKKLVFEWPTDHLSGVDSFSVPGLNAMLVQNLYLHVITIADVYLWEAFRNA